jgi:hypothetical protein
MTARGSHAGTAERGRPGRSPAEDRQIPHAQTLLPPGRLLPVWYSVVNDVALFLGDVMIQRFPR